MTAKSTKEKVGLAIQWGQAIAQAFAGNFLPLGKLLLPYVLPLVVFAAALSTVFGLTFVSGIVIGAYSGSSQSIVTGQPCLITSPSQPAVPVGNVPLIVPTVYRTIFAAAATKYDTDVLLLTTIFVVENGIYASEKWPDPPPPYGHGRKWPVSYAGAKGPFQFEPGTWAGTPGHPGYGEDANHDGVADPNDLTDAAFASAHFLFDLGGKAGTPLGDVNHPYTKHTLVNVMASYNAGPRGNFSNSQTQNYIRVGSTYYLKLKQAAGSPVVPAALTTTAPAFVQPSPIVTQPTPVETSTPSDSSCGATTQPVACSTGSSVELIGDNLALGISQAGLADILQTQGNKLTAEAADNATLLLSGIQVKRLPASINPTRVVVAYRYPLLASSATYIQAARLTVTALKAVDPSANVVWIANALPATTASAFVPVAKQLNLTVISEAANATASSMLPAIVAAIPAATGACQTGPKAPDSVQAGWTWPISLANYAAPVGISQCWNVVSFRGHHAGLDIVAKYIPALAAHDGTLIKSGFDPAAGNYLIFKATGLNNIWFVYEHLNTGSILVTSANPNVVAGQQVATTGNTGNTTGAHLHFGISVDGTLGSYGNNSMTRDPLDYLPFDRSEFPCRSGQPVETPPTSPPNPTIASKVALVMAYAFAQIGKPYIWGADGPRAYDCSGLTMQAFATVGITFPHNSNTQYVMGKRSGQLITSLSRLQPGDLVFFGSVHDVSHVGIYLKTDANGDLWEVNAANPTRGVLIEKFANLHHSVGYSPAYVGATDPLLKYRQATNTRLAR